jgi:hypothetical protein
MSSSPNRPSPPRTAVPVVSPLRVVAAASIIAPFVGVLWIPSYNSWNPTVLAVPYFYWYQLLWVVITAVLMVVAFQTVKADNKSRYPRCEPEGDDVFDADSDGGVVR